MAMFQSIVEEKTIYFGKKIRTYQGNSILVLSLLKSQIMHVDEFVLIPKRMFITTIQPSKKFFIIQHIKKKPLSYHFYQDLNQILRNAVKTITKC